MPDTDQDFLKALEEAFADDELDFKLEPSCDLENPESCESCQ